MAQGKDKPEFIRVRGAREHNLDGVAVDFAVGAWTAVTGPSGSGKTSLVFDTLVREGQARFLGSLSMRARQFFGQLGLAAVDSVEGLPATIAIGQGQAIPTQRSTVGTQTGLLDLLRLLFAREARDPLGVALTRSHFSFNQPLGACAACGGVGLEDAVDPALLVADPTKSIRDGALVPTLKNGYTVYSQVTLEVMDEICRAHGFDVHTPWHDLTEEQRDVILYGTKALKVPFGKHSIESRMRWEGITARPREEGYYRGLIPVIEETLKRNRNGNILRFVRTRNCSVCGGSRLERPGREALLGNVTLPELLDLPAAELIQRLAQLPPSEVLSALRPSLETRLTRMLRLELGHLSLARTSPTLSGGEAQRLRLAAQLSAELGRLLIALDEPTLGLFPDGQAGLRAVLEELRDLGNTLVVVEHDPDFVRHADRLVALGPGAGTEGGRIQWDGELPADPLGGPPQPRARARRPGGSVVLTGARLHNLRGARIEVRLGTFNVVLGPSGAGKSSLVFGTLLPALTGAPGGPYSALAGDHGGAIAAQDARPIGRTPRSTPATWVGLFDWVRKRFAATDAARERGFGPGRFSYNNKEGRCPACQGLGFERITMHLLEDLELPCSTCAGGRYGEETLEVRLHGLTIADVLGLTVRDALEVFRDDPPLAVLLGAMADLGLGYLQLGQASNSLSRGEAQRIKLAALLGRADARPTLLLLDEPDRGLHPDDVRLLLAALQRIVDAGHTVLAISHHRHLWAAADFCTEVRDGVARDLELSTLTALSKTQLPPRPAAQAPMAIHLKGVRTNNLAGFDVEIPHGGLTVIAGVSGSGKSSLAFDTLAGEAWHRFAESLPFQVRRFARRMPRPRLESATGLGPTLALRQGDGQPGPRSSVATASEVGPLLRLLWSRAGRRAGRPTDWTAEHFHPDRPLGACPTCEGRGVVLRCSAERLVSDPGLSLAGGALAGTKPGRYFTERDGQTLATLRAAAPHVDWDSAWETLDPAAQRIALEGTGDKTVRVSWRMKKGAREGKEVHQFEGRWEGFCALVEKEALRRKNAKAAAQWREPLREEACGACGGARLAAHIRDVMVGELLLHELMARPLEQVAAALAEQKLDPKAEAVRARLWPELRERLGDLCALGLGHLSLDRACLTLSDGELQRTRLAGILRSGLRGITLVLDEPDSGLHARDVDLLLQRLRKTTRAGNSVVLVSHRPEVLRAADRLVELGPGAGSGGGHLLHNGRPQRVLAGDGPTARALSRVTSKARDDCDPARPRTLELSVRGASAHNLAAIDVHFPAHGFVVLSGVSGSGKSSLLHAVLGASLEAGAPRGCRSLTGFERFESVRSAHRFGRALTPLTALHLMGPLQKLYGAQVGSCGLTPQAFSFLSPKGRCEACGGTGREQIAMDFLADLSLACPLCGGTRYRPEVLEVRWQGLNVAEFLDTPIDDLIGKLPEGELARGLEALIELGLGYLCLGRPTGELSGGERQRLSLAEGLFRPKGPTLHLLDEPAKGLHEEDLVRLITAFRRLAAGGDLVIATEHRLSLIAAADHVIDLGPGGGPAGGKLVEEGPPGALSSGATALALERHLRPPCP